MTVYAQTFDAENRLISITVNSQTTQFIYGGDGNLVKKIKPDGSKTIYIGSVYEVDKTSGGSVTRTITYYPVAGAMRIDSTRYFVLKDQLGSASVVTNSSGTTVGEQRYYPFGQTRLTTGTMYTDKLFTGQREMAGLGIYHYGARFYSPGLGRFLSADTIVPGPTSPQAFNRYSYTLNNPVRYTDPSGHACVDGTSYCVDPISGQTSGSLTDYDDTYTGGNDNDEDEEETVEPSNTTLTACAAEDNCPPAPFDDSLLLYSAGGGSPNHFIVYGTYIEREGDYLYGTSARSGLEYYALYDIGVFENGARIRIKENYYLTQATPYTSVDTAGSVLTVSTDDNVVHTYGLGEFNVMQPDQRRSTVIDIYGSHPVEMHITIYIYLEETLVTSPPLSVFQFDTAVSAFTP